MLILVRRKERGIEEGEGWKERKGGKRRVEQKNIYVYL